jgi:hypothetical protein
MFKVEFFVVAVSIWSKRVVIGLNMLQDATRPPPTQMTPWGWGRGRKNIFVIP